MAVHCARLFSSSHGVPARNSVHIYDIDFMEMSVSGIFAICRARWQQPPCQLLRSSRGHFNRQEAKLSGEGEEIRMIYLRQSLMILSLLIRAVSCREETLNIQAHQNGIRIEPEAPFFRHHSFSNPCLDPWPLKSTVVFPGGP